MTVHTTADGPVTVITIDRPEVRNAVDQATAEALGSAFEAADTDEDTSVTVSYTHLTLPTLYSV